MFPLSVRQSSLLLLTVLIVLSLLTSSLSQAQASGEKVIPAIGNAAPTAASLPFGYGLVMANALDYSSAKAMGFNWIMVFDPPGLGNYPNVLRRVKATYADLANLTAFRSRVQSAAYGVTAIQIGNEPNLSSEWHSSPNAGGYRQLLCEAYSAIRQMSSTVVVVSGGLAPTGRVSGTWNGHPGNDGLKQDEREFLKEFIAAGGGDCLDIIGYNALGFRANYDAEPDVDGGTPDTNCANGLCFRSVEKFYEILQASGLGQKPVWATEVGWLTPPPNNCLSDPRWPDRIWQIVMPQKQADNLVGAFRYARQHWSWMKAMFVFNYEFNAVPWYDNCEQMRYYSVNQDPTYSALVAMSKIWTVIHLPLVYK